MSDLERIERETKERRKDVVPLDVPDDMFKRYWRAEVAVDQLLTIAKDYRDVALRDHTLQVVRGSEEYRNALAVARVMRSMLLALKPINMDNEGCLCVMHKDCDICRALDVLWKWDEADTAWVDEA